MLENVSHVDVTYSTPTLISTEEGALLEKVLTVLIAI